MRIERLIIQLPSKLKRKLAHLCSQGYTASGYIRALLERELGNTNIRKGGLVYWTRRKNGARFIPKSELTRQVYWGRIFVSQWEMRPLSGIHE
jgi:hypothetical protein